VDSALGTFHFDKQPENLYDHVLGAVGQVQMTAVIRW